MRYSCFFFSCALVFAVISSCETISHEDSRSYALTVGIGDGRDASDLTGPDTRILSSGIDENRVTNMQLYVFNRDGSLNAYGSSSSAAVTVVCSKGPKCVRVLVNAPTLGGISNLDELEGHTFALTDNSGESLIMTGGMDYVVTGNSSCTVEVSRLCAKIVLNGLSKAFSSPLLQARRFMVNRIYVTNVSAATSFSAVPEASAWYNKMGYKGDCDRLLCDEVGEELSSSSAVPHTFYVYPNPSLDDTRGGSWSARCSRLVIDTSLDGERKYYVLDVPGIERNRSYVFSGLTITRPGSDDEENVTKEVQMSFNFSVKPWTVAGPYNENL